MGQEMPQFPRTFGHPFWEVGGFHASLERPEFIGTAAPWTDKHLVLSSIIGS